MQCPMSVSRRPEKAKKRPIRLKGRTKGRTLVMLVVCVVAAEMVSAEPGAFISQREVTNADVFQQKQRRQQQDVYNGQLLSH